MATNWGKWKNYTTKPVQGVGLPGPVGPMGMRGDPGISKDELRKLLLEISALSLRARDIISSREYTRIHEMIESPDKENWEVADALIKQLNNGSTDIHNDKGLH